MQAFKLIKANAGAAGVDEQSLADFELNLKDNLYKLWNRLSSGSYPVLRGWIQYYGCYNRSSLYPVLRHFNKTLVAWAMKKYKRLKRHKTRAVIFLLTIVKREPRLFAHWKIGMGGRFA